MLMDYMDSCSNTSSNASLLHNDKVLDQAIHDGSCSCSHDRLFKLGQTVICMYLYVHRNCIVKDFRK